MSNETEHDVVRTVLTGGTVQGLSMVYAITECARPVSGDHLARLRAGVYGYEGVKK